MEYLRIGAISPPDEARAAWVREQLSSAMKLGVKPVTVPQHEVKGFTANLQPHVADWVKGVARNAGVSPAVAAAGLIEAVRRSGAAPANDACEEIDPLLNDINPALRPLAKEARKIMREGKIAFCEGATGTGKGRMLMYFALHAVARGEQVVVSAPLPIVRQLIDDLWKMPGGREVSMVTILGRPNFVSPEALEEWATEADCQSVLDWVQSGGKPRNPHVVELGMQMGVQLNWLLEEALALSDDIPVSQVMLSPDADDAESCDAEQIYQSLRKRAGKASLIFCSHHLLALHARQLQLKIPAPLPEHIDLLLVDEAHLLEQAFASIFSQTLHLRGLERVVRNASGTKKTAALNAIESLCGVVAGLAKLVSGKPAVGLLDDMPGLKERCEELVSAMDAMVVKKSDKHSARALSRAKAILRNACSGKTTLCLELTPVKECPMITSGQANLQRPFELIWDQVAAAALVSATLYTDGTNGGLMRWKVAAPKPRSAFLQPVIPAWVRKPVTVMKTRVSILPDESDAWHDELAAKIEQIASQAKGGTLVLATAYATVEGLKTRLASVLGERLIVQSPQLGSAAGAALFRAHGRRPVWIAVGAAWTGIDLSDKSLPAAEDFMLTDEVICRIPFGANRSLPHHRRMQIAGPGVNMQETIWYLRQGIGRLVRREGVTDRKLWVLDSRIDSSAAWMTGIRRLIKSYRSE